MENLNKLIKEIEYLKESHRLLVKVASYLSPYDYKINENETDISREIHEHLYDFDDNE